MGRLSKADIVTRALEIVGITQIQTTAELWMDLLLEQLARDYRWPDLQKEHSENIGDGTEVVSYPSDYAFLTPDLRYQHVGTFQQSGSTGRSHVFLGSLGQTRASSLHTTDGKGTPGEVADDRLNARWILNPISNVAGTLRLEYQRIPPVVASAAVVWFPDDLALMEAIRSMAEQRQRGKLTAVTIQIKEAAKLLALRAPSRAQLFTMGGPGQGLDRRMFK